MLRITRRNQHHLLYSESVATDLPYFATWKVFTENA